MDVEGNKRVFQRLGPSNGPSNDNRHQKVCYHWRAGKCDRFPCPYLHRELPRPQPAKNGTASSKRPHGFADDQQIVRRNPNFGNSSNWGRAHGGGVGGRIVKTEKVCNYWVQGSCSYGDKCRYLHSWCTGDCFSLLTQLEGHQKVVSGITMPSGSDKLYTGSKDETVRVWDCQSGQCAGVINLGGEVGCMLSEGPWVFVGIPNVVKAWNIQTATDLSLTGPTGQVYALVVGNDLLFAGTQDGTILAWRFNAAANSFEPAATLKGHTLAVVTLVVGANRLYSGSMDHSIRLWSLETLQCVQTLSEHTSVVMSVLCWDQFLLSCSLDKTIKVWAATESGNLEVTYTHNEEHDMITVTWLRHSFILVCFCAQSRFGTWPVAMLAQSKNKAILEGPVCNGSKVIGWHTNERSKRVRRFHVDMSGFAFNSTILWDPKRWHRPTSNPVRQLDTVKEGFQETTFIEQVVEDESQIEGSPFGCSRIMNWHLHLEARELVYPRGWLLQKNLDAVLPIK